MDAATILVAAIIAAVTIMGLLALWWGARKRQGDRIEQAYHSEYDYELGRRPADKEQEMRRESGEPVQIVPLSHEQCTMLNQQWQGVQAHFVADPRSAIKEADDLVGAVMEKRGYPVVEFERRAADVSIDHAAVVTNYRRAHNISRASDRNNATSEDMREAMHNYGALFDDLLRAD